MGEKRGKKPNVALVKEGGFAESKTFLPRLFIAV